jgi:peptidase E
MQKLILTSAGFENKSIEQKFLTMVQKSPREIKALWIPTAAIHDDAKAMLPKCMNDLLSAGIPPENIETFDLDREMKFDELAAYDAVYVCGGSSDYLLDKMHEANFVSVLKPFLEHGGIYIGVSAGSCVCAKGLENNLGFIPCTLSVHCQEGTAPGTAVSDYLPHINLTDNQAIIIENGKSYIFE